MRTVLLYLCLCSLSYPEREGFVSRYLDTLLPMKGFNLSTRPIKIQVYKIRRVCNRYQWRDGSIPKEIPASRNWATSIMANSRWRETGIPPRFITFLFAKNTSFLSNRIVAIHSNSYTSDVVQIWRMPVAYRRINSSSKFLTGKRVRHFGMS